MLKQKIPDQNIIWLLEQVIQSFCSAQVGVGLPLGNLTSQLFSNVYLNQLDQFMKHEIKTRYYLRYADDFVVMSRDKNCLLDILLQLTYFLRQNLKLTLHPGKIFIQTATSGIDFLGWVHFVDHRVLRRATKRRMLRVVRNGASSLTVASYRGLLSHGNTKKLKAQIESG